MDLVLQYPTQCSSTSSTLLLPGSRRIEAAEADLGADGLDVGLHLLAEFPVGEGPVDAAADAAGGLDDGVLLREGEVAARHPLRGGAAREHPVAHALVRAAADGRHHVAQVDEELAGRGGDVAPRAVADHLQAADVVLAEDDGEHGAVGVGLHPEAGGGGRAGRVAVQAEEALALGEVGRRLVMIQAQLGGQGVEQLAGDARHVVAVLRHQRPDPHPAIIIIIIAIADLRRRRRRAGDEIDMESLQPVDLLDAERLQRSRAPEVARPRLLQLEGVATQQLLPQLQQPPPELAGDAVVHHAERAQIPAGRHQRRPVLAADALQVQRRQLQPGQTRLQLQRQRQRWRLRLRERRARRVHLRGPRRRR